MRKRRRKLDYPRPMPARMQAIWVRVRAGERLCRCFRPRAVGEADDITVWWLEPSGKQCGPSWARQLVATGVLQQSDPGLFGAETAQSWSYPR